MFVVVFLAGPAMGHDAPCHADHTCPSDTTPPSYQCGENATSTCAEANAPTIGQAGAAPQLAGPPTAADCESNEIYYVGAICKQVLQGGVASPPAAESVPSAAETPFIPPSATDLGSIPSAFPVVSAIPLDTSGVAAFLIAWLVLSLGLSAFLVACLWRVFTKAGEPGWAALIPIYNTIIYLKIAGKPWWWIFILWLVIPAFIVNIDLARRFGRSTGFGVGMSFLPFVFVAILAFGPAQHDTRRTGGVPLREEPRPLPL